MHDRLSLGALLSLAFSIGLYGCDDPVSDSVLDAAVADAGADWRECDPLVPSACGLPFPSDVYTIADPTTPTGRRLRFPRGALPRMTRTVAPFESLDGFSPGSSPMAHLPGATTTGLPGPLEIARSLEPGSPTVLVDLTTGERVAHFAELDMAYDDDAQRVLLLRPAASLLAGHRYAVAIRDVVDREGVPLAPSATFAALRDGSSGDGAADDEPAVRDRRAEYDALFAALEGAGVARATLQLAWSFTVGSRESITGTMLAMRDRALELVGEVGPAFTLDEVERRGEDDPHLALRVRGRLHVPSFLTKNEPGGTVRRDEEGRPRAEGTMDVPFWLIVPRSAASAPGQLMQWGHGLLGTGEEIFWFDALHALADTRGYVVFAIDWTGMATEDTSHLGGVALSGDMGRFVTVADRLQQGMVNALLAARAMRGGIAQEPRIAVGGPPIDVARPVVFVGQSQGGIFGGTYMALTTDVERGVLLVPGQTYSLLLQRNRGGWERFSPIFEQHYGPIEVQQCLALMQLLWDRAEPTGFTRYLREDRFPGTPPHEVLMMVAINDHQVTTLGAHAMARSIGGIPLLAPENRPVWGLEQVEGARRGSAMIEVDFGVPDVPLTNTVPPEGVDPHTRITEPAWVGAAIDRFLREGVVETNCEGACDPE